MHHLADQMRAHGRRSDWYALGDATTAICTVLRAGPRMCTPGTWLVEAVRPQSALYRCPAATCQTDTLTAYERWLPWRGTWALDIAVRPTMNSDTLQRAEVTMSRQAQGIIVHAVFGTVAGTWAGSLNRIRIGGDALLAVQSRAVTSALLAQRYDTPGSRFRMPSARARRVVRALRYNMAQPWPSIWKSGWGAAWPATTRDFWWAMTASVQFFGVQWRWDHAADPGCRACAGRTLPGPADTLDHMRICPTFTPLWTAVARVLAACTVNVRAADILSLLLYGLPGRGPADPITLIRGAALHAGERTRARMMVPDDAATVRPRPAATVRAFVAELRRHVRIDYCVASGMACMSTARGGPSASARASLRPTTRAAFGAKWVGVAQLRRRGRGRSYETTFEELLYHYTGADGVTTSNDDATNYIRIMY